MGVEGVMDLDLVGVCWSLSVVLQGGRYPKSRQAGRQVGRIE